MFRTCAYVYARQCGLISFFPKMM
uniref:Uncharacterized protein n=1 Tax=Arundo donax TaxID=35708 RepID=A0A0A9G2A1_ARUDO